MTTTTTTATTSTTITTTTLTTTTTKEVAAMMTAGDSSTIPVLWNNERPSLKLATTCINNSLQPCSLSGIEVTVRLHKNSLSAMILSSPLLSHASCTASINTARSWWIARSNVPVFLPTSLLLCSLLSEGCKFNGLVRESSVIQTVRRSGVAIAGKRASERASKQAIKTNCLKP